MKFALLLPVVVLSLDTVQFLDESAKTDMQANPIRKVVTMLQKMQTKIAAEGKKEEDLYEKFVCYCRTGSGDLTASIAAAEAKVPAVTSKLEQTKEKLAQTKMELKQAQLDRVAAKDAMAESTALREKEAKAFASEKADYDTNIAALQKAIAALEKGMAGSFLQTPAAKVIRQLALSSQDMIDMERQELVAFLSESSEYAPNSGEITGILKQMLDTMSKALEDATEAEQTAIETYEGLMAAKKKEVEALSQAIESKTEAIGTMGLAIVQMEEDLSDSQAALLEDQKFLAGLDKSCAGKKKEWEERSRTRAEELVAIAETIKVLNDDDALDLFKKTLPSAGAAGAFVQTGKQSALTALTLVRAVIHKSLASAPRHSGIGLRFDLLAVALSGKKGLTKGGFDKVIAMCDDMIKVLKQEQVDDDSKKEYCAIQLDQFDDKKKATERSLSDSELAITNAEEGISTLSEEIKALVDGIKELDKSVMTATEQRKDENAEYKALMASDTAAKELLKWAKNRLNKFYNPKLYVAPPKVELSAEDRIAANMGGEAPATAAPGGIAGTGIAVLVQTFEHKHTQSAQDAPPPPPETWDAYSKKSQESAGVLGMIDLLIKDLDKEITEAETEEKDSQAEYEQMMSDSADKRTVDSRSLSDKEAAKADLESKLEARKESKAAAVKELMATMKYMQSLHAECDWLIKYYDVRKEARAGEIDSLVKAKAILSGADFSLVQGHGFLRGSA